MAINLKTFLANTGDVARVAQPQILAVKSTVDNELLVLEVDPVTGALPISGSFAAGPVQFVRNSVNTPATLDTSNPSNNRPLPVALFAGDALSPLTVGIGAAATNSLRTFSNLGIAGANVTTTNPVFVTGGATATFDVVNNNGILATEATIQQTSNRVNTGNNILTTIDTKLVSQATAALQTTGNASLASIDAKTAALVGGRVPMDASGTIFAGNSSTTPLAAAGVFTGTAQDTLGFGTITIQAFADVVSATDGLLVEWSPDGTNWDDSDPFTVAAGNGRFFTFGPQARFFRVRYINGATLQTAFRLQTIGKICYVKPSCHRLSEVISDDSDAELQKAVVAGRTSTGTYVNIATSTAGALSTSGNEFAASNYGIPAATTTQRVAAMIGVGTAAASSSNPVPVDIFTNTTFATSVSAARRTFTTSVGSFVLGTQSLMMGWDSVTGTHREATIDAGGNFTVNQTAVFAARVTSVSILPYIVDFASANLTTAFTTVAASTFSDINRIQVQNQGAGPVLIAVGAAAAEIVHYIAAAGHDSPIINMNIPFGSRISIRSQAGTLSANFFIINAFS